MRSRYLIILLVIILVLAALFAAYKLGYFGKKATLSVYNFGEYIDPSVLEEFEKKYDIKVVYETYSTEFDSKPILTRAFAEERNNGTTAVLVRFAELSGQAALGPLPTPDVIAWRPTAIVIGSVLVVGVGYLLIRGKSEDESDDEHAAPPGAVDVPTAG